MDWAKATARLEWETFVFWDLVRLILETWRYIIMVPNYTQYVVEDPVQQLSINLSIVL